MTHRGRAHLFPCALAIICSLGVMALGSPASAASKQGGTLVFLSPAPADSPTLDAAKIAAGGGVAGMQVVPVYDTLVDVTTDGAVKPRIALSVTSDPTFKVWTVKLRKGVTFTDTTPFNANAVIAHWNRVKDPATASPARADAVQIASVRAVDDLTVEATLTAPDASFPVKLTSILGMIPSPTAVTKFGANYATSPESTVGAGPFIVKEWVRSDHTTYARNPGYWDAPRPTIDTYTYRIITDPTTRTNTFTSGAADIAAFTAPGPALLGMQRQAKEVAWQAPLNLVLGMNTRTGRPTSDVRLRNVLVQAANIDAVVQRAAQGATAAHTLFPESNPYYLPIEQPDNQLAKAQKGMKEYLSATSQTSVDVHVVTNAQYQPIVEALAQDWAKVQGLNIVIEPQLSVLPRSQSRDFDMIISQVGALDPATLANQLSSTATSTNLTGISDPELDAALLKIQGTDKVPARKAALTTVQKTLVDESPYVYVHRQVMSYFPTANVKNVVLLGAGAFDIAVVKKSGN